MAHASLLPPCKRLPSLLLALAAGLPAGCVEAPSDWNVVLVTLDTTRADFLGTYGYHEDTTPNLDALAQRGTVFDLALSTSSVTPVAHASILTGRYNHEHGVRLMNGSGGYRLEPDVPTLATVLQAEGYTTAAVHSAFPVSSHFGFEHGFDHFDSIEAVDIAREGAQEVGVTPDLVATFQRRSDETSDRVLELLDGLAEPFFLWVHYWDPHDGHRVPPPEYRSHAGPNRRRPHYAAEVRYMDVQIGRVLDRMESSGQAERTLIAVLSDHGEGLGDHGWGGHRLLYQEQIRIPLILATPGGAGGRHVAELVRSIDLVPTVLDLLGLESPPGVSGRSLMGLVAGEPEPARLAIADQINLFDVAGDLTARRPTDGLLYCSMDREWKLIYRPTHPAASELFHLASDPLEEHDVSAAEPEQVQRLLRELARRAPWVLEVPTGSAADDGDAALEALAALGYASSAAPQAEGRLRWTWACADPRHGDIGEDRAAVCTICGERGVPRLLAEPSHE